jgi:pyruvate,water dikinase
VLNEEDMKSFPEGGIMVVRHTHPEYAAVLQKASGLVADIGSTLGHLATVAREYGVPAVFNTRDATRILENGHVVTVDAEYAVVYDDRIQDILDEKKVTEHQETSPSLNLLKAMLKQIAPLNLTDPRGLNFSPKGCKTFHDITRYIHEISLRAIFNLSKDSHFTEHSTRQLIAEVPLQWWVIDLDDGVKKGVKGKKIHMDDIVSIPLTALWKGMTAVPWKGPPPVDAKGFMSVMFSATTDPSIDPAVGKRFADKNYILVARHFCNVSTRLGFHFSTIESYVGEEDNLNYVSFIYTGGGADDARKGRRADFISRLLEAYDFRVERRAETLFARVEGYPRSFIEERLAVLGHVMVHTRQMDMVMYNDAMVEYYYKDFIKAIDSALPVTASSDNP